MNKKVQRLIYIIFDYISASIAWALFFVSRKVYIESVQFGYKVPIKIDRTFLIGLFVVPITWLILYYISGYYNYVYRKSRLNDIFQTFIVCLIGVIILFFLLILDDYVLNYHNYYWSFLRLFYYHFGLTVICRVLVTSVTKYYAAKGAHHFNTLLIGGQTLALNTFETIKSSIVRSGNLFAGYVAPAAFVELDQQMPYLGNYDHLDKLLIEKKIEEVILSESSDVDDTLIRILDKLDYSNVVIKAPSELYDKLKSITKVNTLFMSPLIVVLHESMPLWQQNLKQILDIVISCIVLIICLPIFLIVIMVIKLTSAGPVIYRQERIGRHGRPFTLFKFRSMYMDAEKNGPLLSKQNDERMTPFGRFLRRTKLDELPNFINVVKGDMAIVGPRPEREYYIDQIIQKAPQYLRLLKLKPGITSMGQIKFGYAGNVEEMIQRLRYDIIYLENMSLFQDLKVIYYTFITVLKGRGV